MSIPIESANPQQPETGGAEPNALELFEKLQGAHMRDSVKTGKEFYRRLRGAICRELEQQGFCTLLDSILERRRLLPAVVYAALIDIREEYNGGQPAAIEDSAYLPHIVLHPLKSKLPWWDAGMAMQFDESIRSTVKEVRSLGRRRHLRSLKEPRAEAAPPQPEAGPEAADAARMLGEAERIRRKADNDADSIVQNARREASLILRNAKEHAETIAQCAKIDAKAIADDAREKAEAAAKERADAFVREYLADEQNKLRHVCDESVWALSQQTLAAARSADDVHAEMCEKTNAYQSEWVRSMDAAIENLSAMRSEFYRHLHDWQVSQYPRDIQPVAERFLELYRILNVDKIVREEIVFQSLAGGEAPSPAAVAALQKLNRTLTTFLRRFETSLNGLGLYAYYPAAGDAFDEMRHVCDDDVPAAGGRVARCVTPGIARKATDGLGDDVVIPAVVAVTREEGGA